MALKSDRIIFRETQYGYNFTIWVHDTDYRRDYKTGFNDHTWTRIHTKEELKDSINDKELIDWLKDETNKFWSSTFLMTMINSDKRYVLYDIFFADRDDAMVFRIMWL